MADTISRVGAVKEFFNLGTHRNVDVAEMMTFWKSLTEEEKMEFSDSAAQQLGLSLKAAA